VITYTARWLFPVSQAPLERGTVTIDGGKIISVDPHGSRKPDLDLGNAAIIPGLVNAHTHLDLSGARGLIPPTDPEHFTDWLMGVIEYRKTRTTEQIQSDVRNGLKECLNAGTTLIGDISVNGLSWNEIQSVLIRSVIFFEMIGLSSQRSDIASQQAEAWSRNVVETDLLRRAFSPHAPYSASTRTIVAAGQLARQNQPNKAPTAIHLAETAQEIEFLHRRRGAFVDFLKKLNVWDDHHIAKDLKTIMYIIDFFQPKLFIHGNHLAPTARMPRKSTIVFCPRTHAAFRHHRHPFKEFLDRDINVALGTDSLASNPDLDIFEEARFVYEHRKDVGAETILKMITINGAKALCWDDECGSLEPGKSGDFVVMPLPARDGEAYELLFTSQGERRTMFRGEWR
jgi:cytosine/adenosine deaminase-related metal-dependent hydrolase